MTHLSRFSSSFMFVLIAMFCGVSSAYANWVPIGPFGGDARAVAADPANPDHMFLGSRTGQVFVSTNGGRGWARLESLHAPENWVVDHLIVDPARSQSVYAAMWSLSDSGGGIYKTTDGGRTWVSLPGIQGQSVRSLAMALSNSQTLVAGTLEGVFRTEDGGEHWQRISPVGNAEIRDVQSVAIDPQNPRTIYAGTWHLAWKTSDGGAHWASIKKGMVDDSDVFSIAVDPAHPSVVYATACTGIYRSDSGGAEWRKIQGIPNSSRRTRALVLDTHDSSVLYAGTTEGLWRTPDGGQSWERLTPHTWVINAILLDERQANHFYLAMDQAGVVETADHGRTFYGANAGYSQREVSRIAVDPEHPEEFYVAVLHDGEFGGVFLNTNGGPSWQQLSAGLGARDVTSLVLLTQPDKHLLAGTPEGVLEYSPEHPLWQNRAKWIEGGNASGTGPFVHDLFQAGPGGPVYAATSAGLFKSADGRTWELLPLKSQDGVYTGAVFGPTGDGLLAATSSGLDVSHDDGRTWTAVSLEGVQAVRIHRLAATPGPSQIAFAATDSGLFRSADGGLKWEKPQHGLPVSAIFDVLLAPSQVLVAGAAGAFYSSDGGEWYSRIGSSGPNLDGQHVAMSVVQLLSPRRVVAASVHNGLFVADGSLSDAP